MSYRYLTYKDLKGEEFRKFAIDLKIDIFQTMITDTSISTALKDTIRKLSFSTLNKLLDNSLSYFSDLEKTHKVVSGFLRWHQHTVDAVLINEMVIYDFNNYGSSEEALLKRMKIDLVTLLVMGGQGYYQLAWNECEHVIANPFNFGGRKKLIKLRTDGLRNIQALIMLYLYSFYLALEDVRLISHIVVWLYGSGYQWLALPDDPQEDLLNQFLEFKLPYIISGLGGLKLSEIYMHMDNYKERLHEAYPNTPETLKAQIGFLTPLPKKYSNSFGL